MQPDEAQWPEPCTPAMQEEKGVVGEMKQATEELARTAEETGIAKSEMEKEKSPNQGSFPMG